MDFKEVIRKRRSVRKFSEHRVEREVIRRVLDEVVNYAPSSRNSHSSRFLVVYDPETLELLLTSECQVTDLYVLEEG